VLVTGPAAGPPVTAASVQAGLGGSSPLSSAQPSDPGQILDNRPSNIGQGERSSGPRPRTGATRRGPRPPGSIVWGSRPGHQADTGRRPSAGPVWASRARKSEREPGTPKASGWFDNRTQTIAPEPSGSPDPEWERGTQAVGGGSDTGRDRSDGTAPGRAHRSRRRRRWPAKQGRRVGHEAGRVGTGTD